VPLLLQHNELLVAHHTDFVGALLPALCAVVASSAESGDMRFFCLRMVSDLLATFLLDADLYDPRRPIDAEAALQEAGGAGRDSSGSSSSGGGGGGDVGASTAALNAALHHHVLPLVPLLLHQEDPMPLYALKVWGSRHKRRRGH
jgi:serine/threonine-protein kinase ULK4